VAGLQIFLKGVPGKRTKGRDRERERGEKRVEKIQLRGVPNTPVSPHLSWTPHPHINSSRTDRLHGGAANAKICNAAGELESNRINVYYENNAFELVAEIVNQQMIFVATSSKLCASKN